jgi:PAS domain S-box-containing protein
MPGRIALGRFFDLSPDLLCITAPDHLVRVNPAFSQALGYSDDDLASRPYLDLVDPEDRNTAREILARLPGSDEPARFENRLICSDGSRRWVEWNVVWHRDLYYAAGRDITERRRRQDELNRAAATTQAELIASRTRLVAAADEARRRLERDLHDRAQQQLVSLVLHLRLAEDSLAPELADQKRQLAQILSGLTAVSDDLREISRGIHPAILSKGGLGVALKTLARRSTVPVNLDVAIGRRFADPVEVATYYVVAEALTNAAKHAKASEVTVGARHDDDALYLSIRDDGVGGADFRTGSGLIGLRDRIEALGGQLQIESPPGQGTSLHITIPV